MKRPEYITMIEHSISIGSWGQKILPVGSFVQPIDPVYLPAHIKDSNDYRWMKPSKEFFCYTHFGIVLLPKSLIRRINE